MPDKKLADSEIVKALGNCRDSHLREVSDEWKKLSKDALDLINRLQAENEMLITECGNQSTLWSKHFESIYESAKETIKAEAYKEFTTALERKLLRYRLTDVGAEMLQIIHNLLKEMVIKNDIGRYGSYTETFVKELVGEDK